MIARIQDSLLQLCPLHDGLVERTYFSQNDALLDTASQAHFSALLDVNCDLLWSSLVLDNV